MNTAMVILQTMLGSIGGLALLVASIGIANTMVMAIYERTREIGILKAIGASSGDIRVMFVTEAALIGLMGGVAGTIGGWLLGLGLYVCFLVVLTWCMVVNPHFEKSVRIQEDRGHKVIDRGPYGMVRHPGYVATMLGFIFATPLLLGSWWAFIPAFVTVVCLVARTALEDRTLLDELPGYAAYARRVRYRLVPGIW